MDATVVLAQAEALWRGPALSELSGSSAGRAEITRLDELRMSATESRIDARLATGAADELLPELERLVAAHPFRERLRAQLMLALYRSGRQADALTAFRRARLALDEELGVEPGARSRPCRSRSCSRIRHSICEPDRTTWPPTT